ncbi:MAG: proline--tRNA ligase [Desulfobacteraceae bacterium]
MAKKEETAVTPTREDNYPLWYQEVIKASDMAETSAVRGCMVIKPWGYALWENMVSGLDEKFKRTGVKNAYFPLFIPLSYLEKEAEHVEGFAKECAVVTHHRLEKSEKGLKPAGKLDEPLIVRPTSETIIGESMANWTSSYRDLPILLNQWSNVVRWEMRTRLFLRTSEFLWQEGHTAHATREEAEERTMQMLNVYTDFVENHLAMPVIKGRKTESERFPGAVDTTCIEAMMQDRKALQAGTSHFLGQNFAKSAGIKFQTRERREEYAWTTSWGVSTRMVGGLIMMHGDDNGVIMPPRVAPAHVVLLPILKKSADNSGILEYTHKIADALADTTYHGRKVVVEIDDRDTGGARGWEWIKKGVPVRAEIGPRDMEKDSVFMATRDCAPRDKKGVKREEFIASIGDILDGIQNNLFNRALAFRKEHTHNIDNREDFYRFYTNEDGNRIAGGFTNAHWCGSAACEEKIKNDLSVTIRCIPFDSPREQGECICCGEPSSKRVLFSKAY